MDIRTRYDMKHPMIPAGRLRSAGSEYDKTGMISIRTTHEYFVRPEFNTYPVNMNPLCRI